MISRGDSQVYCAYGGVGRLLLLSFPLPQNQISEKSLGEIYMKLRSKREVIHIFILLDAIDMQTAAGGAVSDN